MYSLIGYLYVGAASALWASAGVIAAIASDIPAPVLGAVRALSGSVALCLFIGSKNLRTSADFSSSWRKVLATSVWLALFQWSFFASVELAGASMASIISTAAAPFAVDGIGLIRRGITPSLRWLLCCLALGIGLLLPIVFNGMSVLGMIHAAVAGMSYAAYTVTASRLERASGAHDAALAATAVSFAGAAIVLLPAALPHFDSLLSVRALLIALYLGFATTALAYTLFLRSLQYLTPSSALNAAFAQPLAAITIAGILLDEKIDEVVVATLGITGLAVLLRKNFHSNQYTSVAS